MNTKAWCAVAVIVALTGCESLNDAVRSVAGPRFTPMPDTTSAWEHPELPWEKWDDDRAECRALAIEQTEREYALDRAAGPSVAYSRTIEYQRAVSDFELRRFEETAFERCMTNRGYRRVPRSAGDDAVER